MPDPREVIARALCEWSDWEMVEEKVRELLCCEADTILSALREAGYAVVPVEATPDMMRQGGRALHCPPIVSPRSIWRAMVKAAQGEMG